MNPSALLKPILARLCAVLFLLSACSSALAFTHPGVPLTTQDLAAVKAMVDAGAQPWKAGYDALAADSHSQLSYTMQGPFAQVSRNPHINRNQWLNDMAAIWNLARMWYFTGNDAYAQKSHDILLAWANTQTSFDGMESNLDLGDQAFRFVGGAEILRCTWPGWTAADTAAVQALFGNVYWPATGLSGYVLGPGNKGGLSLSAAVAIAVFNDDQTKFDKVLYQFRTFPSTGLQNTLSNGEHGETGRDQGHSYGEMLAVAFTSEVFWKQGVDVYSERNNRVLAMGEYYARLNLLVNTPFVSMGTTDEYYHSIWDSPGFAAEPQAFNIMKSHYALRKGLHSPYLERKLDVQAANDDAFMFLKPANDNSTATPPAAITFPSSSLVSTGLSNLDIGGATPAGSGTYSNGVWNIKGAGAEIWTHTAESCHFTYQQVTGDFCIIAKVESVQNTAGTAKAGVMVRSDLNADPTAKAWVAITAAQTVESYMDGWGDMYGGSNWEKQSYWVPQIPYWVKIERVGDVITCYASPDGTSWATQVVSARYTNMGTSPYVGLVVCSLANGTLNSSTFSNVSITGGNGAAPVAAPAAPLALLGSPGDGQVPLRWTESFGATSYNVKRSATRGGPYTTVASVPVPIFTDATATNDSTCYYVVSAVNSAGEGGNSPEEAVTPRNQWINIAANNSAGTVSASANDNSSSEGSVRAFDLNSGSKWFNGNSGTTGWIQYDLGAGGGQAVSCYQVVSANDVPGRDPAEWQLLGSNDGSSWTTLDTQTGQTFNGYRFFPLRYSISNATAWRYYRLNVTANNGDATGLQLSELALFRPAAPLPAPAAPTGLSATPVSLHQVDLSWGADAGASSYIIKRAPTNGGPYTVVASEVTDTAYSNTGLTEGTTYYYVVTALGAGGESADSSEASATTMSTVTLSATSIAVQDGYILAASGNSSGGSITSNSSLRTGDNNQNRQYKAIVSFDTSSVPDNAVIVSATLKLRCSGINGSNPFSALGACYVDIKGGNGFNNSTTLETTDFQASADASQVAAMSSVSSVGTWSTGGLNTTGLGILNKLGTTQFRVYSSTPTNNNNTSDYLSWNSGDDATAAYRPVLELVYSVDGPSTSPKAYLRFDESTGTTASDSSGNGWAGSLVNGATWSAGKFSNAVNLSGSSYVNLPPGVVSSLGDFTISAWVKVNTLSTNSRVFDFGTNTTPGATTGSYMFLTPSNGSAVRFAMTTAGYSNEQAVAGTAPLTTGTWAHVAVRLSGSACTLYVNGTDVGTNTAFSLRPYNLGSTMQNYIGKSQYSADPGLNGSVDEFRVYNRALSTAEITALANPPLITSALANIGRIGTSLSYQITATNTPTSYSAAGLPAGLTLSPNTGWITGAPTVTGTFDVTLGATNPAGTGTATLVMTVLPQIPVIASVGSVAGFVNTAFSYQITATNAPSSYGASGLPAGLGVSTNTGLISGTPTVSGTFGVALTASNDGGTGSADLSIVLGSAMAAPTGLTATVGNGSVTLHWDAVVGASSYTVRRSLVSGSNYSTVSTGEVSTSFVDSDLTNWTTYYYVVNPVNDYGEGPASSQVSAMPMSPYTWTGAGADANWQTAANWSTLPTSGVTLYFAGSTQTSNTNNFAVNTPFAGLVFNSGAGAFTLGGNAITLTNDIVNNSTSSQTISLPVVLSGNSHTVNTATGNIAISGSVSGGFGLVKSGSNTLTLSGNNAFIGGVALNAGTIVVASNNALGSGTLALAGAKLQNTGNVTLPNVIFAQPSTSSTLATSGNNLTLAGNLTGSGTISRVASGSAASVYLYGTNSGFTGTFISSADSATATRFSSSNAGSENGRWIINTTTSTRASVEFAGSGTIRFGSLTGLGYLSLGSNAGTKTIEVGSLGLNDSFTGIIGDFSPGIGAIRKVGPGTWTLTGVNTYSGLTMVESGTLAVSGAGTLGASSGSLTVVGGTVDLGSTSRIKGVVTISSGSIVNGTLAGSSFVSTDGGTVSVSLSGSGATLVKSGSGTLTLAGTSTYTGATTINGGTLKVNGTLGSAVMVNSGGTLSGTGTTGAVTVGANGAVAPGDSAAGTLSINGALTLNSGAVLNMELGALGASDTIQVSGSVAGSGTTTINVASVGGFGEGTYSLISGSGISVSNFAIGTGPAGYGGTLNASGGTLSVTIVKIPDAPSNVFAAGANSSANLTWSAVSGAVSYNVKRSTTSGSGHVIIANVASAGYTDPTVANGTTYFYVVSAVNSGGESANSLQASALPLSSVQSWRLDYFGTIDNSGTAADAADPDSDGATNGQEFAAGTDPNNRASILKISQLLRNGNDTIISFPTVAGKTYRVERSDSLQNASWIAVEDNILGSGSTVDVTDPGSWGQSKRFYRISLP